MGEAEDGDVITALREPAERFSKRELMRFPNSILLYMSALERGSESDAVDALLAENQRQAQLSARPECGDFRHD